MTRSASPGPDGSTTATSAACSRMSVTISLIICGRSSSATRTGKRLPRSALGSSQRRLGWSQRRPRPRYPPSDRDRIETGSTPRNLTAERTDEIVARDAVKGSGSSGCRIESLLRPSPGPAVRGGWAMPVTRVFVVAEVRLYREGLAALLGREGFDVVGTGVDAESSLAALVAAQPE